MGSPGDRSRERSGNISGPGGFRPNRGRDGARDQGTVDKRSAVASDHEMFLVASSDLSHYYPSDVARKLDAIAIESIRELKYEALMSDLETDRTEACGGGPIVAVLYAAKKTGADYSEILHSCNSGDVSGDTERVVGYVSAALWKIH